MPIDTPHPSRLPDTWMTCRDVIAGEDAVHAKHQRYLPVLEGLTSNEQAYLAYVNRATFYPATGRTVVGLTGLVLRKPATVVKKGDQDIDDLSGTGNGLVDISAWALREVLGVGRAGILLDWNDKLQQPTWTTYCAEEIWNWHTEVIDGLELPTLVVLKESELIPSPTDPYAYIEKCGFRELALVQRTDTGERICATRFWTETKVDGRKTYLSGPWTVLLRRGSPIVDRLPFVFLGPLRPEPTVERPPLLDLVKLNLSHYRTAADHEHALHFVALPTPYVTGWIGPSVAPPGGVATPGKQPGLKIGSGAAWLIPPADARVGILEFTGQGLGAIEKALERKEAQMSILGTRLLEGSPQHQETAEAVRLRRSGEGATLATVTRSISLSLTDALRYDAWWRGMEDPSKLAVTLNQDYLELALSANEIDSLVKLWQAGGVSYETLYWNLQQGEIARPNVTVEEEQQTLKAEEPDEPTPLETGMPVPPGSPGAQPPKPAAAQEGTTSAPAGPKKPTVN